jgi:hypothetical protein
VSEVSNSSKNQGGEKACKDCGERKPLSEFPRNAGLADGYGIYCKACFAIRYRKYREQKAAEEGKTIRERRVAPPGQKWCAACSGFKGISEFPRNRSSSDGLATYCKPCHNAKAKETHTRLYGGTRQYHLKRRYGLSIADVDAMIEAQGGTCAVCPGPPQHVDHDHATGEVRGILCFNCNQALGNARDNPMVLRGLARYLDKHRLLMADVGWWTDESPLEVSLRKHLAS